MKKERILQVIFVFFFSFLLLKTISGNDDDCFPSSCGPTEPEVRFPFRITDLQPSHCGFPGFDLSCNKQNQTIFRLPTSRPYIVNRINYFSQVISIDPEFCRPNRIENFDLTADFNLTDTPFDFSRVRSYSFYNCSLHNLGLVYPVVPFPCLSSVNYSVIAVRTGLFSPGNIPSSCEVIKTISVPVRWSGAIRNELEFLWFTPYCKSCEIEGRPCRLKSDDGQITCLGLGLGSSRDSDGPRDNKLRLSIGIGIPAFICIVGLLCYVASRGRDYNETYNRRVDFLTIRMNPQPPITMGLDGPTIESYPMTVLGESCRLPSDNSVCAICLSDYKSKESLRTIPECEHYFHAVCVDEWLKLNASCPVCRNSPESSSLVTPCSSASTSVDSS